MLLSAVFVLAKRALGGATRAALSDCWPFGSSAVSDACGMKISNACATRGRREPRGGGRGQRFALICICRSRLRRRRRSPAPRSILREAGGRGPPRAAHQMRRVHVEIPAVGQGQSIYNNFKDILQMFI